MDILERVIYGLTSDEVRRFKILSNRFKAEDEKKLLTLFDIIRSDKYGDEEQAAVIELYAANNPQTRNRYYRLRNKLLENLEKSLTFYHFKYKDSIHAYYDIQLSIMFRERGAYQVALYYLKKAEKKARDLDQFNILEIIYHEYTQLAMKDVEVDIEEILDRRKSNLEKVKIHRRNSEAIAILIQQLKRSNFQRDKSSVLEHIEKTKQRVEASADIFHSTEGKIQVFRTVSALLLQKDAFEQLVSYTRTTLEDLDQNGQFNNDNHSERLLMRLWLVNSLFKTFRFKESQQELEVFEAEMQMYRRQNYFTYLFHFINARVNVLKCLGQNDACESIIREALTVRELRTMPEYEVFLTRSLADQLFLAGKPAAAAKVIASIPGLEAWESQPEETKMYLAIFELVVKHEQGEREWVVEAYGNVRKTYRRLLKSDAHARVALFLELFGKLCTEEPSARMLTSVRGHLPKLQAMFRPGEQGGNEIIIYDLYIQSQVQSKPYYALFLEQMGKQAR